MNDWFLAGLIISSILSSAGLLIIIVMVYRGKDDPDLPPDWLDEFMDRDPGWNGKPPKMMKRTREWLYDDEDDEPEEHKLH